MFNNRFPMRVAPDLPRTIASSLTLPLYVLISTLGVFMGGLWGIAGIGGAILLFIAVYVKSKVAALPPREIAVFVGIVLCVFAVEIPFSSQPVISLRMLAQLGSIFLPLSLLTSEKLQREAFALRLVPVIAFAMIIGTLALGIELLSGGVLLHHVKNTQTALSQYNRGLAHTVILAFPLLAGLWIGRKKPVAVLLLAVLLFAANFTESHTAKLALILGLVTVLGDFVVPVVVPYLMGLATLALPLWPFAASWVFEKRHGLYDTLAKSAQHRIEIWDYLSYRILEKPVLGWGLGSTRTLDFHSPHSDQYQHATFAAPHAHNLIVCVWVETGMVGLALCLAFLLFALRSAARLSPTLRPFALGCWTAALTVSLFGFDVWTDALWASFALATFMLGGLQNHYAVKATPAEKV